MGIISLGFEEQNDKCDGLKEAALKWKQSLKNCK